MKRDKRGEHHAVDRDRSHKIDIRYFTPPFRSVFGSRAERSLLDQHTLDAAGLYSGHYSRAICDPETLINSKRLIERKDALMND